MSNRIMRILVVDDNQVTATTLSILLKNAGHHVETAFNAAGAIAKAQAFSPEVCILDINMPGMNGYELARTIREQSKDHPPLMATVTAYSDNDHLDRAVDAGFDLHFTKPADVGVLVDQLRECLNR